MKTIGSSANIRYRGLELVSPRRATNLGGKPPSQTPKPKPNGRAHKFPYKLFAMLEYAQDSEWSAVVSWSSDGREFYINNRSKLLDLLARFFQQTKFKSFTRQLNLWGFNHIDPEADGWAHEHFVRGNSHGIKRITYLKVKGGCKGDGPKKAKAIRLAYQKQNKITNIKKTRVSNSGNNNNKSHDEPSLHSPIAPLVSGSNDVLVSVKTRDPTIGALQHDPTFHISGMVSSSDSSDNDNEGHSVYLKKAKAIRLAHQRTNIISNIKKIDNDEGSVPSSSNSNKSDGRLCSPTALTVPGSRSNDVPLSAKAKMLALRVSNSQWQEDHLIWDTFSPVGDNAESPPFQPLPHQITSSFAQPPLLCPSNAIPPKENYYHTEPAYQIDCPSTLETSIFLQRFFEAEGKGDYDEDLRSILSLDE